MTDDETESVLSDSHEGSELELPVIQLCGLVEELRRSLRRLKFDGVKFREQCMSLKKIF
ncbi:CCDC113 isoform 5 [Pan troglodytes]|uniref:CCDC113 isoform 5 n=1 Tax=Pan troglodytes TaxID=9598 RepID=A0A2J8MVP7_PANTR|nr:CCDC113 isoform 5 [Pan troglodytes]